MKDVDNSKNIENVKIVAESNNNEKDEKSNDKFVENNKEIK